MVVSWKLGMDINKEKEMTFIWKKLCVYSIIVDGQSYTSKSKTVKMDLEKGVHKIDVIISNISVSNLRIKILLSWISNLCGAVVTMEDAISDAYDNKISFDLAIDDCNMLLNLDDYICSRSALPSEKIVNVRKFNLVKTSYIFAGVLFGGVLSVAFLTLGIIAIQHGNTGAEIFFFLISTLSLALTIGIVAKTIKETKKRL